MPLDKPTGRSIQFSLDAAGRCRCRLIGSEAGGMRRHNDRLHHELPDRNDRTQNEESVDYRFEHGSILVLRRHDQVVRVSFVGIHRSPCPYAPRVPAIFFPL